MPTSRSPSPLFAVAAAFAVTLSAAGCQFSPFRQLGATPSTALPGEPPGPDWNTRADDGIGDAEDADGLFIGLALSGGGSRSAVFAGEILDQLHRSKAMARVDYISCVSGGSMAGAYYCLSRDPDTAAPDDLRWNDAAVREHLAANLWLPFVLRGFTPGPFFGYWFAGYSRSCNMADVFDTGLFHGKTLGDLNPARPRVLINATQLESGKRFTFTNGTLAELNIRPAPLRVADCVQASSAVPGFFQTRAFPKYGQIDGRWRTAEYIHLMDGGVYDNLGMAALVEIYRNGRAAGRFRKGGVIVLADASALSVRRSQNPEFAEEGRFADLRRGLDYLLELRSLKEAADIVYDMNVKRSIAEVRAMEKTEDLKLIHLWYGRGVAADYIQANGRRPAGPVNLEDPLRAFTDVPQVLALFAPTALSITPEQTEVTRQAARTELKAHRDQLQAAGLPLPD